MNRSHADELQDRLRGACMLLAPVLLLLSTVVYWTSNERWGGTIQVYAFFLFIPAALGLSSLLWNSMPRLAIILRALLLFGCVGGIGYGLITAIRGAAEDAGMDEPALAELANIEDSGLPVALNLPGVVFPLAIVAVGISLWRTRAVSPMAGLLLAVAGVSFPISRIPDVQALYYVADGLFIVSLGWIGMRFVSPSRRDSTAATAVNTA